MIAIVWASPGLRSIVGLLLGLLIGSFLGAVVTRWPRGESVAKGRSHCDGCGALLRPHDLVPVVSALAAGLRCRQCGVRIDPAHLVMEIGCGTVALLAFALSNAPLAALGWSLFGWLLLALALLDWRHFWLPDALTLPLAFLGLTIGPFTNDVIMIDRWIGAAAGYGGLMAVALGYRALRGREGLGWGDAKLLGAIGAWAGWLALPFVLLIASLLGLGWAAFVGLKSDGLRADMRVPLGTFLCVGTIPAMWAAAVLGGG